MKLQISNRTIELLDPNPDYAGLPQQQAETYRFLLSLEEGQHSERALVEQLGFASPLPLWLRIEHLEERGLVQLQTVA